MATTTDESREERLKEQRRALPDQPGVYLFRDARGQGRLRRQGEEHPQAGREPLLQPDDATARPTCRARSTTSSTWSSTRRRRRCSPSRTSSSSTSRSSTSGCATTSRTRTSRSASTRTSRASTSRASATGATARTSGRTRAPSACATRSTCSARSSSTAPARARRPAGTPARRAWTTTSSAAGRPASATSPRRSTAESIDGVMAFLSGRFKQIERDLEQRMYFHAGEQDFEQAAVERNRLQAIRALLERQRVADSGGGSMDAVARRGRRRGGQRAGLPGPRRRAAATARASTSSTRPATTSRRATEEFLLQYYASALSIPALIVVPPEVAEGSALDVLAEILAERRGGRVEIRAAERGSKRRILDLAERNARLALDQDKLKAERRRQQRVEALDGLQAALRARHAARAHRVLRHLEPDGHAQRRLDGRLRGRRAEEVRLPALPDPRPRGRPVGRLRGDGRGADAPRRTSSLTQRELSPYDKDRDASFAALPNVIVIDGGKGQLAAGLEALQEFRERGVVRRLAGQAHRGGLPARRRRSRCASRTTRRSSSCCSACATRRTASRSPTTARRRDKAMTESILDGLPGVGADAQARAAQALRLAGRGARRRPRGPRGGARPARRRSAATLYAPPHKTGR